MTDDPDVVADLFAQIATEPQVIDLISAGAERLRSIQLAKQRLASLHPLAIRTALARLHQDLGEPA